MLSSIKSKDRGFTIVELLIVIVVIAILAAISIVAYNGIQNRAKTSAGEQLASQVAKKAQAYNTLHGEYPSFCQLTINMTDSTGNPCSAGSTPAGDEAKLDNPALVVRTGAGVASPFGSAAYTTTVSNGNATVAYANCTAVGGVIYGGVILYYDYTTSTPTTKAKYVGTFGGSNTQCLATVGGP